MPKPTRAELEADLAAARRALRAYENGLSRMLGGKRCQHFDAVSNGAAVGHVIVTYPPRPGASEDSYQVFSVDREAETVVLHHWEMIADIQSFLYRSGDEDRSALANAFGDAKQWILSHMEGKVAA